MWGCVLSESRVLAGNIGGTKSSLALFQGTPEALLKRTCMNRKFAGFAVVVECFLADTALSVTATCFDVDSAVVDGACRLITLGWRLTVV